MNHMTDRGHNDDDSERLNIVPEPVTECPNCYQAIENENELIRFHSPTLNKTILACVECKQNEDMNQQKPPLFNLIKDFISEVNTSNSKRIERYVNNYCKIASKEDAEKIKQMFNEKINTL